MRQQKDKIILTFVIVVIFFIQIFFVHKYLTSIVPGANDFYSRWAGARALLIDGRNPYSLDVTYEIQEVINIDHSQVGRGGFAYPLHVIFLFFPLIFISYPWTQAIWWVMLQWMSIGTAVILLAYNRRKFTPWLLITAIIFVLTFYPVTRSIFLGQFTIPVLFFLSFSLLLLQREHDGWAGAILTFTSIKPQMVIFIVPLILLWVFSQKRYRFFTGFFGTGITLLAASLLLFVRWPLSFLEDMLRYRVFAGGRNPLVLTLSTVWPNPSEIVFYLISGILILYMLYTWWQCWRKDETHFQRALHWTIVVELLILFQTGTTNFVLLLIPIFSWLTIISLYWGRKAAGFGALTLNITLWGLFFSQLDGNAESKILFLPLPWLSLTILIIFEIARYRQRVTAVTQLEDST